MELYRVLLVDDEEDIREGISRKMDWLGLGFSLVGEAANGQDALELAESLRPDVILTDIKMPFMDGLELCRILTDRLPAARFVVFSGFDAFEYAKQAIQMNVVEYILKPINADELSAVLRRLKDQLDRERAERCLRAAGLEPKRVQPVRHNAESPVSLLLLEARRGGRPGLTLLPELLEYETDGTEREALRAARHAKGDGP